MIVYTDGSAHPNPGPGGFGVVVLTDQEEEITRYAKHCDKTTNNREELRAILWTLLNCGRPSVKENVVVYSDSAYAINCLTIWRYTWERNGWVKGDGQVPENIDLIKAFHLLWNDGYRIELRKVHGHSGNKWNELADKLARTVGGKEKNGD